eukprot:5720497-Prymnesium_polylepis.1
MREKSHTARDNTSPRSDLSAYRPPLLLPRWKSTHTLFPLSPRGRHPFTRLAFDLVRAAELRALDNAHCSMRCMSSREKMLALQ